MSESDSDKILIWAAGGGWKPIKGSGKGYVNVKHWAKSPGNIHPLYNTWRNMIMRCIPSGKSLKNKIYRDRGITVCSEWRNDFVAFCADMGPRPQGYSLDRINPLLGYCKSNCRWADAKTQAQNKESVKKYELNGVAKALVDWANGLHISYSALYHRVVYRGWDLRRALETPKAKGGCF